MQMQSTLSAWILTICSQYFLWYKYNWIKKTSLVPGSSVPAVAVSVTDVAKELGESKPCAPNIAPDSDDSSPKSLFTYFERAFGSPTSQDKTWNANDFIELSARDQFNLNEYPREKIIDTQSANKLLETNPVHFDHFKSGEAKAGWNPPLLRAKCEFGRNLAEFQERN
jgi:hypothetical protein